MPATFVHPAAVVPLFRGRLVPSALVIGSMMPDVYQLPFPNLGMHDWVPGLLFCPLQTALMLVVFHALLKRPLVDLAGPRLRGRLAGPATGFRLRGPAAFGWLWLSAVLGTATHLLFYDITHGRYVDWGLTPVIGTYSGTQLVQEGLSLLGLVALVLAYRSWYRTAPHVVDPGALLPAMPRAARTAARAVLLGYALAGVAAEVIHPRVDIYRAGRLPEVRAAMVEFDRQPVMHRIRGIRAGHGRVVACHRSDRWRCTGWVHRQLTVGLGHSGAGSPAQLARPGHRPQRHVEHGASEQHDEGPRHRMCPDPMGEAHEEQQAGAEHEPDQREGDHEPGHAPSFATGGGSTCAGECRTCHAVGLSHRH
ncbi:DUF4184 family protein [Streptomyces sp. YJ-C3]